MRDKRLSFWALLALAVIVRFGYGLSKGSFGSQAPNPDRYLELATGFAKSGTLSEYGQEGRPSAHREPVYPVYLGLWIKVLGPTQGAVLLANSVLTVLFLSGVFFLSSRVFSEETALLSLAIASVYPPFIYYSSLAQRETAMLTFSVAGLCALVDARRRQTMYSFAIAGAVAALSSLTNTTSLPFFLILAPVIFLWIEKQRMQWAMLRSVVYVAALIAIYALWPLRNWHHFHTWIAGSLGSGGGANLYIYQIVPQEDGGTSKQSEILANDPIVKEGENFDEFARDHWYWKAGVSKIKENPLVYLRLVSWRFFWDMWRPWPRPRQYDHSYTLLKMVSLLTDGWIIPLAFITIVLIGFSIPESLWLSLFIFSVAFVYSLVFTMLRYRLSLMPEMIIFAAEGLRQLRRRASL